MVSTTNDNMELQRARHISFASANKKEYAVYVRNAFKSYGTKMDSLLVLDGLDMTVPKGVIYGLLGSSGCGKTTLLNCILGRKRLHTGDIWVLGGRPGSKGSGVPGPRIGYMPQSVGLYGEFTIAETLKFFGWVVDMDKERLEARTDFLIKLLMLPHPDRIVKTLSGGQQRRVSLAAALLHEPELLVLDEPTVGLDPVLRQNIWDHLVRLTSKGETTVIITTHYIDETRQANLVAFMRSGYLLTETSPNFLLREFNTETLEGVFLKLSEMQNVGRIYFKDKGIPSVATTPTGVVNPSASFDEIDDDDTKSEVSGKFGDGVALERRLSVTSMGSALNRRASVMSLGRRVSISNRGGVRSSLRSLSNVPNRRLSVTSIFEEDSNLPPELPPEQKFRKTILDYSLKIKWAHMKPLLWKNLLWMMRNVPIMIFIVGLPFIHTTLFCSSIGNDPKHLEIAVVNYESNNSLQCSGEMTCNSTDLGCLYLNKFLVVHDLRLKYYDTDVKAREAVKKGFTWAAIVIKHKFSESLHHRIDQPQNASDFELEESEVEVVRELSNSFIAQYLRIYIYQSYQSFLFEHLESCGYNKEAVKLPLQWKEFFYGERYPKFLEFVAPGITVTAIFFMALALTALAMLVERSEGSFERSLIIGITGVELILAHVICQFFVVMFQAGIMLSCLFFLYDLSLEGSPAMIISLTFLCGFCGMCFGLLISCLCNDERTAFFISMGSTFPMLALGGVIWPVEGMHYLIQPFAYTSPLTLSVESFRSILHRGWGMSYSTVYLGFISTGLWAIFFLILSIMIIKFKKG